MSSLFSLPKYPLMSFLSEWFEMKEIAKLDSAVCNKINRDPVLKLISEITFTGNNYKGNVYYVVWVFTRHIKVATIHVDAFALSYYKF